MTDNTKAKRKALELEELQTNLAKAKLELANEEIRHRMQRADYEETHLNSPDETGEFHFFGEVTEGSCYGFSRRIRTYAARYPERPITVVIQTQGGSAFPGLGLYDDLRTLSANGHHITTKVRGWAASFGVILLQAGDTRLIGAESHLMVHELSTVAWGKLHEIRNEAEFAERLNKRLFDILAARSKGKWTGRRLYAHVKGKDLWLDAREAIDKYGLADDIG